MNKGGERYNFSGLVHSLKLPWEVLGSGIRGIGMSEGSSVAPKTYFNLSMGILLATGMYPMSSGRSRTLRFLYATYYWSIYIFVIVLNPVTKAIALFHQTNIDELTDNLSFLINHIMTGFKIALFMVKRKDLVRLVQTLEGGEFRHEDCCPTFSANLLIRKAVHATKTTYYVFSSFVVGLIFNSILNPLMEKSEEIRQDDGNATGYGGTHNQRDRSLPFHSWYPFSTQESPTYEFVFFYQISALFCTAQMVMALDTMVIGFMIHIKVQFEILSHNLRFNNSHSAKKLHISFPQHLVDRAAASSSQTICCRSTEDHLAIIIEEDLRKNIDHHKAIIQLSKDLQTIFGSQLLFQFVASLLATCTLLWQVSSTPVMTTRFASMLSYLGATAFQLFIYCWFGNEMMLESLSVADAAWDSGWYDRLSSRRYCHGLITIIYRSQREIKMTAGGFIDLTLDTFLSISRAAYSCFAVLKEIDN